MGTIAGELVHCRVHDSLTVECPDELFKSDGLATTLVLYNANMAD